MSNSDVLLKMFERDPENVLLRGMLIDARAEEAGTDPDMAVAWVDHVRDCAIAARVMARAAKLLRAESPNRRPLLSRIALRVELEGEARCNVILIDGDAPPRLMSVRATTSSRFWMEYTITVSASWVIQESETMERAASSERRRARSRRDRQ